MKPIATFSIVAYDPTREEWGVAVQSKFLAVGAVVPFARAGVGAVATQSYANYLYGPEGLELMAGGMPADQVIARLTEKTSSAICARWGSSTVLAKQPPSPGRAVTIGPVISSGRASPARATSSFPGQWRRWQLATKKLVKGRENWPIGWWRRSLPDRKPAGIRAAGRRPRCWWCVPDSWSTSAQYLARE